MHSPVLFVLCLQEGEGELVRKVHCHAVSAQFDRPVHQRLIRHAPKADGEALSDRQVEAVPRHSAHLRADLLYSVFRQQIEDLLRDVPRKIAKAYLTVQLSHFQNAFPHKGCKDHVISAVKLLDAVEAVFLDARLLDLKRYLYAKYRYVIEYDYLCKRIQKISDTAASDS